MPALVCSNGTNDLTAIFLMYRYFQGALRAERGGWNRCYVVAQGMQVLGVRRTVLLSVAF